MFLIVAHHYVVNSGMLELMYQNPLCGKSIFLFLFGMWGKTGINCFVLITGYFMCTSKITLRKFLKLLLMLYFYKIVIYGIFVVSGYQSLSLNGIVKVLLPFTSVTQNFVGCYLLFYLTIPFLNILVWKMTARQHFLAVCLGLLIYTVIGSIPKFQVDMNYVSWFIVLFLIGSYLRLHPEDWFGNRKLWAKATLVAAFLAIASVICLTAIQEWQNGRFGTDLNLSYFLVADSNKILAVATAICSFMLFKNLGIKYNKTINTIASATFGVLLIHANSDAMRHWLWRDTLDNTGWYINGGLEMAAHALISVTAVYAVCTVIELLRAKFIETPVLDACESASLKIWDTIKIWKTNR